MSLAPLDALRMASCVKAIAQLALAFRISLGDSFPQSFAVATILFGFALLFAISNLIQLRYPMTSA